MPDHPFGMLYFTDIYSGAGTVTELNDAKLASRRSALVRHHAPKGGTADEVLALKFKRVTCCAIYLTGR